MAKPYINRLQDQVAELQQEKAEALRGATDLLKYLASEKFQSGSELDGYVSVEDVAYWLQNHVTTYLFPKPGA